MLAWSVRRRLFYLLMIAGVFGAISLALIWRLTPEPSCFDGRKNQTEEGVDCGGLCSRICLNDIRDLKVLWTRVLPVLNNQYDVAALIANPNRRHGAKQFGYLIKLIDNQGILITTTQGRASLNPGETLVVYNSRLNVGQREPARATLEIVEAPTWQQVDQESPALRLQQRGFSNNPFPTLIAELSNDNLDDWRNIEVIALLSDTAGNAFAVSSTVIDLLPRQSSTEVAFTWPQPFLIEQPVINFYTHLDLMAD